MRSILISRSGLTIKTVRVASRDFVQDVVQRLTHQAAMQPLIKSDEYVSGQRAERLSRHRRGSS